MIVLYLFDISMLIELLVNAVCSHFCIVYLL
jgi:hypothetical protein